jgi:hypothetical protein
MGFDKIILKNTMQLEKFKRYSSLVHKAMLVNGHDSSENTTNLFMQITANLMLCWGAEKEQPNNTTFCSQLDHLANLEVNDTDGFLKYYELIIRGTPADHLFNALVFFLDWCAIHKFGIESEYPIKISFPSAESALLDLVHGVTCIYNDYHKQVLTPTEEAMHINTFRMGIKTWVNCLWAVAQEFFDMDEDMMESLLCAKIELLKKALD